MKVLLVVASFHHRNTEKVAREFATVLNAEIRDTSEVREEELKSADLVGLGSGIDSSRHYGALLAFADSLPCVADHKAFIFSTCGMPVAVAGKESLSRYAVKSHLALREKLTSRGYRIVGEFSCAGHNSNSFLKLFGGLNKGRPNAEDLDDARKFARKILEESARLS